MRHIFIGRKETGTVEVRIMSGFADKRKEFQTPEAAREFAEAKMGKTGVILGSTTMTPEQLAAEKARDAKFRAAMRRPQ